MLRVSDEQLAQHRDEQAPAESLDVLLAAWEQAKTEELRANALRMQIEKQLCEQLEAPEEGQKSYRIGVRKVTRTNKLSYRGNLELVLKLAAELQLPNLSKQVLDETAVKRLRKADPYDFDLLVSEGALTVSPAKPHFEVVTVPTADLVG